MQEDRAKKQAANRPNEIKNEEISLTDKLDQLKNKFNQ